MPFDGMLLHRTLELPKPAAGAKIGKIQSLSEDEVLFVLHHPSHGTIRLAISVHSNTCRLYESSAAKDTAGNPSSFVMLLRKRIGQGIITAIEQIGFDRIVRFEITAFNEFGDRTQYHLYAELMGKYANLLLVDPSDNTIIDCLKRIPVYENSKRLLHPGAEYVLPEKPERETPLHPASVDPEQSLVKQIEGFSPCLSREFQYRMKNGQSYSAIMDELLSSDSLYQSGKEFHCLPLLHLEKEIVKKPLMEGLEQLYQADETKKRIAAQCGDVFKAVSREIRKLERKLPKLKDSLEQSKDYDRCRQIGDVLFANLDAPRKPVLQLPSFEEEGEMLEIEIDMRFSIKDNANRYYKKYHKLKRGIEMLEQQIAECENDLEYYELLADQLDYCSAGDVQEIRQELVSRHVLRAQNQKGRGKKGKPNITVIRMDGAVIYAGKNNLQNQYITWNLGKRQDLWFHVKDYHGSHVLLQSEHPTEEQIRMAAMTAAWFSKGRHSSSVPIDYTTISMLKKVPGKGPGFVTMKSYQTIYIDPDPKVMEEAIKTKKA